MTLSRSNLARQASLGASIGAHALLSLITLISLLSAGAALFASISRPESLVTLPWFLLLGTYVAIPALISSLIGGAIIGPLAARVSQSGSLPGFIFPVTAAFLIYPFVLLPIVQSILWLHDTMQGVVSGYRTVLEPRSWRQLWPLAPLILVLTLCVSWWRSSRYFSIPVTASQWWVPLDRDVWSKQV